MLLPAAVLVIGWVAVLCFTAPKYLTRTPVEPALAPTER